jgi:hypothetical protein
MAVLARASSNLTDRPKRPSIFIRDKSIFSSERMLHKDNDRKGSAQKNILVMRLKRLGAKTKRLAVNRQS